MANAVSPSNFESLSKGQITKLGNLIVDGLEKTRHGLLKNALSSSASQVVIEQQGREIVKDFVDNFRKRVEAVEVTMNMIVRRAVVDRALQPAQVVDSVVSNEHIDYKSLATIPLGDGGEVDVYFFNPRPWEWTSPNFMSDDDLAKAFDRRGLKPDPRAQAKVNRDDSSFADYYPNAVHWKDVEGYIFMAFATVPWSGANQVSVGRGSSCRGYWWIGGVRK